jgi:hypothetical protein
VFSIRGKVVSSETGESVAPDGLTLFRRGSGTPGLTSRSTGVKAGEFSFDAVLPGDYVLETKLFTVSDEHTLVGREIISVANADLDGVVVEMKRPIEVTGKVIIEGSALAAWPQITLTPTEGLNYPDFASIDDDGRFAVNGLEHAAYLLNIGSLSPPFFLKTVLFNGRESHSELIDLTAASTASIEIVISDRASSSISGQVRDSERLVGPGITVLALQAIPAAASGRVPTTRTDENGHFSLSGLPPGDYVLFAIDLAIGRPPIPALLAPGVLDRLGKSVSVGDGDSITADIRLTNPDDLWAADLR